MSSVTDSEKLSYRQQDVLGLLALGVTVEQSRVALGVSRSTVEHERTALRRKLGANGLPHAVAIAYDRELLPLRVDRRERLAKLIRDTS